jgi:hypothetical protein
VLVRIAGGIVVDEQLFSLSAEGVSAIVAAIALFAGWLRWRRIELRREDALAWANDVIETMQSLVLICSFDRALLDEETEKSKLLEIAFRTSVLVEQGRLLFKNIPGGKRGRHKAPAYRGTRPLILDQLIVAHEIAQAWPSSGEDDRKRLHLIAEDCKQRFVSLAQQEVGRDRTASTYTKASGDGRPLDDILSNFDDKRLQG